MQTPRPGADAGTLRLGLLAGLNLKEDAKNFLRTIATVTVRPGADAGTLRL